MASGETLGCRLSLSPSFPVPPRLAAQQLPRQSEVFKFRHDELLLCILRSASQPAQESHSMSGCVSFVDENNKSVEMRYVHDMQQAI